MSKSLVSITIPTFNSAQVLNACLESVAAQDYPHIETIVIDSNSTDATRQIASTWKAACIVTDAWLLGARVAGIRAAQGDYVLLLDSDHVLMKTAVTRAVAMMQSWDVLYMEEKSLETRTLVERLFDADRRLLHSQVALHADPLRGVLLGRFFRRDLLVQAVDNIPPEVVAHAVTFDHEIINYEVLRLTHRTALLPDALWHQETRTIGELWRKNFRYGKMARQMARLGYYADLRRAKARPRLGAWQPRTFWWGLQSNLLLALKAPAIIAGYVFG